MPAAWKLKDVSCELLSNLYWEQKLGSPQIAERFGVSAGAVRYAMHKHGISLRSRSQTASLRSHRGWTARGYILVWLPPGHKFRKMARRDGYVLEHRLVMAELLGRSLKPYEKVHHKSGKKDDNRSENLELFPIQAEHLAEDAKCQDCSFRKETYHNTELEVRVKKLEERVETQGKLIRLLRWKAYSSKVKEI